MCDLFKSSGHGLSEAKKPKYVSSIVYNINGNTSLTTFECSDLTLMKTSVILD